MIGQDEDPKKIPDYVRDALEEFGKGLKPQPRFEQFGPFQKVVQSYAMQKLKLPQFDPKQYRKILEAICPSGKPAIEYAGQNLKWRRGLVSLCRPGDENLGAAAAAHSDVRTDLLRAWVDLDEDISFRPPDVGRFDTQTEPAAARRMAPGLPIENRAKLSDRYVRSILKPYCQSVYECRQIFWKALEEGHRACHWICLVPDGSGSFVPLMPGSGFDGSGAYSIDRSTYLKGQETADEDEGRENFPHSDPYQTQGQWLFLSAEDLRDHWFYSNAKLNSTRKRASAWMDRVIDHFEAKERRPNSGDLINLATVKFDLSPNAARQAWKSSRYYGKRDVGTKPHEEQVEMSEINMIE